MKFKWIVLAMVSVATQTVWAGNEKGSGGKTVVCRNADGSIHSAEILDLYEGRTAYQLNYSESAMYAQP